VKTGKPEDKERAGTIFYVCANLIKQLAVCLYPFTPFTSEKIWTYLQLKDFDKLKIEDLEEALPAGHKIAEVEKILPLFNKITEKEMQEFRKKFGG
jgi:methionyl-tRNA synthetase